MTTRFDSATANPEIQGTTLRANSEFSGANITRIAEPASAMPKNSAISPKRPGEIACKRIRTAASSGGASISRCGNTEYKLFRRLYNQARTRMEYRKLGSLNVSLVGIGCNNFGWRIDAAGTAAVVDTALDAGINFFDTADVYGAGQSEEYLGKALKGRRDKAIIATKFGMKMGEGKEGARPQYIREALDASLRRLQVNTIDLYQIHRPDPNTSIADTMQALNDAVAPGKVREIGCSNFTAEQLRAARGTSGPRYFASVQNDYSMLNREPEAEVLPECARTGVAFLPYFPLANGLLTGKYRKGKPFPESSRGKDAFGPKLFTPENMERV